MSTFILIYVVVCKMQIFVLKLINALLRSDIFATTTELKLILSMFFSDTFKLLMTDVKFLEHEKFTFQSVFFRV